MDTLLDSLAAGTTQVTATRRLARYLRFAFDIRQQNRGLKVWESPDILPWTAWLQRCWEQSLESGFMDGDVPAGRLLRPVQEGALWNQVIEEASGDYPLLQVRETAKSARDAWGLLHAWQIPFPCREMTMSGDTLVFRTWVDRYEELCRNRNWFDGTRLPDVVAAAFRNGALAIPSRLLLTGFDELTPQQQVLLDVVKGAGCEVLEAPFPQAQKTAVVRVECADIEEEVAAAARWVRRLLDMDGGPPRIAVVVPDLANRQVVVERVFDDVLVPQSVLPGMEEIDRPFNISLGRPLLNYPLIHDAFLALELDFRTMPLERLGQLLRSPFIAGGDGERTRRGLLDARLRQRGEPDLFFDTLRNIALGKVAHGGVAEHACPHLVDILTRWQRERKGLSSRQMPSAWVETISRLLQILGWPGDRGMNSHEIQVFEAWRTVLAEFSTLDAVSQPLEFTRAVAGLRHLAAETPFQPFSPDVPVQVLGVLEAAGMEFDHLWVMGLHDEVWPPAARPNPFLPGELQRQYGLPHASAERELTFARRITGRLLGSAPKGVVSYPRRERERDLRPSPLISGLPAGAPDDLNPGRCSYIRVVHAARALERLDSDTAPPVPAEARVNGGTGIFKQQAACPFRAFAEFRLGASEPEPVRVGLDLMERGILVHTALETLWRRLKSHDRLCALTKEKLAGLVRETAARAIAAMTGRRPVTFTERFSVLEQDRLEQLLQEWLELEKQRTPFMVVEPEQERLVSLGGIELRIRVDRVDRLENGGYGIIDYKTGIPKVYQWQGERPDEPQLPLYAVTADEDVRAVLFAQVRRGDMRLKGFVRDPGLAPGLKAFRDTREAGEYGSWQGLKDSWGSVLEQLGKDFCAGHARVDPKDYPGTCQYCGLMPLCRVNESLEEMESAEEGGADD